MRGIVIFCLALGLPLIAQAADRDVNRDGRLDQADVTALGRMVAGLDPVDLSHDQNGDGVLTLEDVNLLLDAIPPDSMTQSTAQNSAAIGAVGSSSTGGTMAFYALRQKATGQCVVVAGEQGISPGDTIYGVFTSFGEAQGLLDSRCNQGSATPAATNFQPGLPLSTDRLYRPDKIITRGKWGTAAHIGEDPAFKRKLREPGLVIDDGFFTCPGHGGDSEILWSHDGSALALSGVATVIDCIDYCGGAGSVKFTIRGDGRELWSSGLVRHGTPPRTFSVSLDGIHELRLIINDGGNGVDEDWGGWLNLKIGNAGSPQPAMASIASSNGTSPEDTFPPILAIPKFDDDDSIRDIFSFALETGRGTLLKRVRKSPLDIRALPMRHNLFQAIGRAPGQAARDGQVLVGPIRTGSGRVHALLVVDTTTGKMGYLTDLDDDPAVGTLRMIDGAPAQSIASDDGNYTMVMRRTGSGKTLDAYLFHGTTGRCQIFMGVGNLKTTISARSTIAMPKISSGISSLPIQGGNDATSSALLIDPSTGALHLVGSIEHKPAQLTVRTLSLNLTSAFRKNPKVASTRRFVPVPITDRSGATTSALIVDVGTGTLALLDNVDNPSRIRPIGLKGSIYDVLPENVERPRTITAVPKINDSGITKAAWLFDSASGDIVFVKHLQDPQDLELRKVVVRR
jgi:hypothetical protein